MPTFDAAGRRALSRRAFARLGLGLSAGALLAACAQAPAPTATPAPAKPTEAPKPAAAAPSSTGQTPSSGQAPATAQPTAAAQPTVQAKAPGAAVSGQVQFWDMVWGPPEYIDSGKKLVDQFNQQHPSIKATYQSTAWSGWPQVFTTAIGSGTAPDISSGAAFQAVQFYAQGAILAIDDVVTDLKNAGKLDDFLPGTVDRLKYRGHNVALPWAIDIRLPYYRKDLLDKAGLKEPTNWDELRAALKKLTSGDQYGYINPGNSNQPFMSFLLNNAGGFFTPDGKLDVMTDRNIETFTFLSSLVKDKSVHPGSAGTTWDDAVKVYGSGKTAMIVNQPGLEQRFPDQKQNIVLATPFSAPHGDKGTISWVNNIMLYTQTKNPDATKAFLTWWSENQKPLWTEGHNGQVPTRNSIASDPYFQTNPYTKQTLEQWIPIGQNIGAKVPGIIPELNDFEGSGDLNTLTTDILQGMDPKEALGKAEAGLKKALKQ
jgi:multiple sugar transport system substrate-binding protein